MRLGSCEPLDRCLWRVIYDIMLYDTVFADDKTLHNFLCCSIQHGYAVVARPTTPCLAAA